MSTRHALGISVPYIGLVLPKIPLGSMFDTWFCDRKKSIGSDWKSLEDSTR